MAYGVNFSTAKLLFNKLFTTADFQADAENTGRVSLTPLFDASDASAIVVYLYCAAFSTPAGTANLDIFPILKPFPNLNGLRPVFDSNGLIAENAAKPQFTILRMFSNPSTAVPATPSVKSTAPTATLLNLAAVATTAQASFNAPIFGEQTQLMLRVTNNTLNAFSLNLAAYALAST